jgi:hypothetical protein
MSVGAVTYAASRAPLSIASTPGDQRKVQDSPQASESKPNSLRIVFNPQTHFDASARVFVMEYRNLESGKIERQTPDDRQLRAYQDAIKLKEAVSESSAGKTTGETGSSFPAAAFQPGGSQFGGSRSGESSPAASSAVPQPVVSQAPGAPPPVAGPPSPAVQLVGGAYQIGAGSRLSLRV